MPLEEAPMQFGYLHKEIFPMRLFRLATFAFSMALVLPFGSSAIATISDTPPPPPLDASLNSRTLDLRETASRLVVETVEDALRAGGIALFDERFQIDSSLDWVLGEAVGGELDAVVPLWSRDGHVVFTQPGFVLWNGLADDDRLDGNLGVVYRTNLLNTPVGFDAIGGVSLFYDHDFQIGHSRIGIGVDVQRDGFYGAFNYYQPLSDTQDGREGYVEDALQGMDASLAVESDVTRVGGNVGYWLFQGDEDVKDEWEFSYGLDAGLRLMPGVFLEGRLERHDKKASFGRRASVGLAFRFTLPNLDGKSYGDGGTVSNLYRPVDRESRILYEEREAVPKARLSSSVSETDPYMVNVAVQLEETFAEEVVLNLIGAGSATYNDDWTISVGGDDCPVVDGTDCSVTVMAGETSPSDEVVITFQEPARGEPAEDIILSVEIASTGVELAPGNPVVVQIPEGAPLPTVSLSADSTSITEGNTATITLTLSEPLGRQAAFNLTGSNDDAEYSSFADYHFTHSGTTCAPECGVVIPQGDTSFEVTVHVNADSVSETTAETFTASLTVQSTSTDIVQVGSPSVLNFSIPADPPLPTVTISTSDTTIMEGLQRSITFTLSEAVDEEVTLNLIADTSSTATYGGTDDWVLNDGGGACTSATGTSCQITIPANSTTAMTRILVIENMSGEGDETAIVRVMVDSGSRHLVQEGSQSRLTFTIPADPPLPTVSLGTSSTDVTEGDMRTITVTLSESLARDATFHLVTTGDAKYGLTGGGDWVFTNISCVSDSSGRNACPVTISQGNTSGTAIVMFLTDTATEMMETATVTVEVDSGSTDIVALGSPPKLDFSIQDDPPPTASLNYTGSGMIAPTDSARMRIDLSESLSESVTVTLVAGGTAAFSKNGGAGTWSLRYLVLPENSNPAASFPSRGSTDCLDDDITGTGCEIDIPMGHTVVDVLVDSELLASEQTIMVTLGVGSAGSTGLTTGTSSTVMLTAQ